MQKIRLDINGLKGLAILSVVFYHLFDLLKLANLSENTLFDGGFLGVDIFFVISGFLICGSILDKLSTGDFSVFSFYKRRFVRIVPPLLFVCLFTLILGYFLLIPDVYRELNVEVANALIFIGNFRFANLGGYFALDSSDKLLLHTWYLCVTIQFYIIFPLIVLLIKKILGIQKLSHSLFFVFILTLAVSVIASRNGKDYLLTQCRIYELFFGAVVYCYKDVIYEKVFKKNSHFSLFGEITGIVLLIISVFTVKFENGIWSINTSLLTLIASALIILSHNRKSLLRFFPLFILGKSSYSLYLWHWPLFIFALRCGFADSPLKIASVLATVIFFTFISYILCEKRKVNIKIILLLYIICASSYFYFHHNYGKNYLSNFIKIQQIQDVKLGKDYTPSVAFQEGKETVWHYGLQAENPHVFFVGDSNSAHYMYYLKNINKTSMYFLAEPAVMAYGKEFSSMKIGYYLPLEVRYDFYKVYKYTLNNLKDGDKVVLSNRWDVQYEKYCYEYKLKKSDSNFERYLEAVIHDLDEQISLHPKLKFYIISNAIMVDKTHTFFTSVDLTNSFLGKLFDKKKYETGVDSSEKLNRIVNSKLKEYSKNKANVKFIDRDAPIRNEDGTYSFTYDDKPLFLADGYHYTNVGGIIVGRYIMEHVLKDQD